jgi:peroxiredoxin Q/BCP
MARKPEIGDKAPDFTLPDEDGQPRRLYDALERGPVMLVFYPGDFTPTCTKQLCEYRDEFGDFLQLGLQILGISDDAVEKHHSFKQAKSLPFPLLADPDHKAIDLYCGRSLLAGMRSSRANYIISKDGVIRYAHDELVAITYRKADDLLERAKGLKKQGLI